MRSGIDSPFSIRHGTFEILSKNGIEKLDIVKRACIDIVLSAKS